VLQDGAGDRFFDVIRNATWHTLLLFEGDEPSETTRQMLAELGADAERSYPGRLRAYVVAAEPGPGRIGDPDGLLHERYQAEDPSLYVIRPDGYIALRGRPPELEVLRQHLDLVLRRVDRGDASDSEMREPVSPMAT
jgi:hypothetical protein